MPKQSRGFWICDFCGSTFDRFEEANSHENLECRRQPSQQGPQAFEPSSTTQFKQDPYLPDPMPPFSTTPEDDTLGGQTAIFDYGGKTTMQSWKRPLLTRNESTYLRDSDRVACENLELFALGGDDFTQPSARNEFAGQLGLRCCFCRGNFVVPENIISIADHVRRIADGHLASCGAAPRQVCSLLEQAARRRTQRRAEGGPSWHEEQSIHRSLVDFCVSQCQQYGVVNKHPENTGIVLGGGIGQSGIGYSYPAMQTLPPNSAAVSGKSDFRPSSTGVWDSKLLAAASPPGASKQDSSIYRESGGTFDPSFVPSYSSPHLGAAMVAPGAGDQSLEPMPLEGQALPHALLSPSQQGDSDSPHQKYAPGSFPFYQAPNGDWICRYCTNLPPEYRVMNYIWSTPSQTPPESSFVDYHLSMCREYLSRMNYSFYSGTQSYPTYSEPQPVGYAPSPQQQSWEQSSRNFPSNVGSPIAQYADYSQSTGNRPELNRFANPHPRDTSAYMASQLISTQTASANTGDLTTRRAIEHLVRTDSSNYDINGILLPEEAKLVLDEDRLLLTDYFFYVIKQLRLVRFSEADRRTRGGKREKIQVGYGGLQCAHCAHASNARKFFWSNVDRLANSFAEIPAHILKCRSCPSSTKEALLQLKQRHPEQMAHLPRGSQKIFFRRMWRRLHDDDPLTTPEDSPPKAETPSAESQQIMPASLQPLDTKMDQQQESPDRTTGSDESILLLERSSAEAAKALIDAVMQTGPPSPSSRILLATPEDKEWLSDIDCFVRRQIEVFCATKDDVAASTVDYEHIVYEGQVGIRCVHCALTSGARLNAVAYPSTISGLYESVREFQRVHIEECVNVPPATKAKLTGLKGATSLSSVLRQYYIRSARALGLHDTKDGIRACGKSLPLDSQSAFSFSEGKVGPLEKTKVSPSMASGATRAADSNRTPAKKRKSPSDPSDVLGSDKSPSQTKS